MPILDEADEDRVRLAYLRRDLHRAREAYWQVSALQDPERFLLARERYYALLVEEARLAKRVGREA